VKLAEPPLNFFEPSIVKSSTNDTVSPSAGAPCARSYHRCESYLLPIPDGFAEDESVVAVGVSTD